MSLNFKSDNNKFKKGLYLISTPIGNLEDITLRAIEILKNSDHILCEDTRVSKNLLKKYNINSNLISYHKFNEAKSLDKIIKLLQSGSLISLISDAGTPVVSDPGKLLVNECIKNDITIVPIPGPSAVTSAITVSGFSEKFYFYGFLPDKKKIVEEDLSKLSELDSSIIFFISAKKLYKTIREMTKIYEEFMRDTIKEIDISKLTLKGELTVVLSEKKNEKKSSHNLTESDKKKIKGMINKLSLKEITKIICLDSKISKKEVYNYCLRIKGEK
jgi:16S rRNA (cytidine1402-2'-O)-methyltransferase